MPTNTSRRKLLLMDRNERRAAYNSTFAIGGVSFSADSLVVAESFVLRINISGKKPAHRKSAKRYVSVATEKKSVEKTLTENQKNFSRKFRSLASVEKTECELTTKFSISCKSCFS